MKIRALRGVCVGIEQHLKAGDIHETDPASSKFLVSIGAAEHVVDEPVPELPVIPDPVPDADEKTSRRGK